MPEKPFFRQLLQASTVGLNLVFSTFIGLAIGYGLDSLFHTAPWLTIIFLVIGIIAGFRELLRMAKKQDNGTDTKNT
ncbi:MAG: AtpZ/AtpI family protein [Nitrospirota bacterium]|nr:AtpZ/AtpI family protein [Nitrospirota bacterium]